MLNKKILIPFALITTAIFAIGYGITTNYEPLTVLFNNTMLPDSGDNPPAPAPGDISGMFNERGFYKTNGTSFDDNEMVNDFNGNLMYEIPMYSMKSSGEISCNVKLVYNGSVAHQVIISKEEVNGNAAIPYKYNINCPEWIINLNGFGVQTLNFETDMLSVPNNVDPITGNEVKKLIPGYHFDDKNAPIDGTERDKIFVLMGDGSSLTFVNKNYNPAPHSAEEYTGSYFAESKGVHYKAQVTFIQSGTEYDYMNRKMEVMLGDGLLYTFNEYKVKYEDMEGAITSRSPQIMLLEEIRDRFGNTINIGYDKSETFKGRPRLTQIDFPMHMITLSYSSLGDGIFVYNNSIGNYKLRFLESINYGTGGNKTAALYKIINPILQEAVITNQGYQRKLTGVPSNVQNFSYTQTILCNNLNRIEKFKTFLGASHVYQYIDRNDFCTEYVCMDINYASAMTNYGELASSLNKGYGRDPFYVNTVKQKNDFDENNTEKTQINYDYYFSDGGGNNFLVRPIDPDDVYRCTTTVISKDANTVNNSESFIKERVYKIYPVKNFGNFYNPENIDVSGITKLIEDYHKDGSGNLKEQNVYDFDIGTYTGTYYPGSFEQISRVNTASGISRRWDYIYKFKDASSGGNMYDSIITEKAEVDPNGYKTHTIYRNFDELTNFLAGIALSGTADGSPVYNRPPVYDAKRFYKLGLPETVRRFNNNANRYAMPEYQVTSDELLKQQTYTYITDTNTAAGYLGQLVSEKNFAQNSVSSFIETQKYEYYKQDTAGRYLYKITKFPFVEGNLKLRIIPNNQEEKYFYYLVTHVDTIGESDEPGGYSYPRAYYKVKYNNGNVVYQWDNFTDTRMPTKVDNYRRTGTNSVDTLSVKFALYNSLCAPYKMISSYGFLTRIDYESPFNRVKAITLPGDFSTTPSTVDVTPRYDTMYANVLVPSNGWGKLDYFDNDKISFLTQSDRVNCGAPEPYFNTEYTAYIAPPTPQYQKVAAIRFEYDKLGYFASIDSAMLFIAPYRNWMIINGIKYFDKHTNDVYGIYDRTMVSSTNCGSDAYVQTFTPQLHSQATNININAYDSSLNCGAFYPQKHNIKLLLTSMKAASRNTLWGIVIKPRATEFTETFPQRFELDFTFCGNGTTFNHYLWSLLYAPKLNIYGRYLTVDTVKTPIFYGGTYMYEYDDTAKTVSVHSRLTHSPNTLKKVKYKFDGFGNIKEKDVYTSSSVYNDFRFAFNFMNQPANNIDARDNSTKLSYDCLGRQKKTLNADNTYSTSEFTYDDELTGYFGTSGPDFVEIQTFTDETNRAFTKYFDALGNLLREEKTVAAASGNPQIPAYQDQPYDHDTTFEGQDAPANWLTLRTDYRYDNFYRLVEVVTPGGKSIKYYYDAFGRQSQRNTPDAGNTRYSYDNNGNLILSQDANQLNTSSVLNTRRVYDGLNRLVSIADVKLPGIPSENGPMGDTLLPFEFDTPPSIDSTYIFNVYDTINSNTPSIFDGNKPSDYYSAPNYTRGNLVATAYKTVLSEYWNYKFYRYDERGNVVKMWQYITGFGWKSEIYSHNSQSQITKNWYQPNQSDGKVFTYGYDPAGRLDYVNQYLGSQPEDPEEQGDYPSSYFTLAKYTYDPNSQLDTMRTNDNSNVIRHFYNNRNWLTQSFRQSSVLMFNYNLTYNANGNIRQSQYSGNYSSNFTAAGGYQYTYIYDNSNRLLKADNDSSNNTTRFDIINGYDKDGNFQGMKRYGSSNNLADDFGYSYFSGTNKLQTISQGLTAYNYTYDKNGNMTSDQLNRTGSIKYDHRNLMTEIRAIKTEANPDPFGTPTIDVLYLTNYRYDEAGNRVRKVRYKYTGSDPDPVFVTEGSNPSWSLQSDEFYVRDVSGKEIAIYSGSSLTQWNIWGLDNVGKINADTTRNYYLKDHLGSIRVVLNSSNAVISAQDYDAWGYQLENRSYNSSTMKYDFTGKERDDETSYDYFGARYYDSRIGRWGGVEPLLDKYVNISPYCYSLLNPINSYDPNGKDPRRDQMANSNEIIDQLKGYVGQPLEIFIYNQMRGTENPRYVYSSTDGFIDMLHFFTAASVSSKVDLGAFEEFAELYAIIAGQLTEESQNFWGDDSQWDPEDAWSNVKGAEFGSSLNISETYTITESLIEKMEKFMKEMNVLDKDDPSIARDKVRIRENQSDEKLPSRPYLYSPYHGEPVANSATKN